MISTNKINRPVRSQVYLTAQEVADHYRVSRLTIYGWIHSGKLLGVKVPGGSVRIPRSAVPDYPEVSHDET